MFHLLYSLPIATRAIKSSKIRWVLRVTYMGSRRDACRVLVGKLEVKRKLGSPRRRWEDNIKMDIQEIGWGCRLE